MSTAALLIREPNPDDDFVLHGRPPVYTERRSFFPTNSDITTTTRDLSQHQYRAALYRDLLQGEDPEADKSLRGSLRSLSRHLRLVSNSIAHNLQEESVAKKYLQAQYGEDIVDASASRGEGKGQRLAAAYSGEPAGHLDGYLYADGTRVPAGVREDRKWLADSEWNTSSGHHVAFADNVPHATLLNRDPSASLKEAYTKTGGTVTWSLDHTKSRLREAEKLRQSVNLDMDLAQVPLTRFTRKDLMASEYFPVTMSLGRAEAGSRSSSASRSRARSPKRLTQSAHQRSRTPENPVRNTDNFRSMKRLEKLYLITSEAPVVASVPPAILSPYQEEIARLRLERLRLEEEHLKELGRLVALETTRGPKPKWYELKDTQFHFEASKNNELLHTLESLKASRKSGPGLSLMSMSQPDLYSLRMREASFA